MDFKEKLIPGIFVSHYLGKDENGYFSFRISQISEVKENKYILTNNDGECELEDIVRIISPHDNSMNPYYEHNHQ